MSSLSTFVLAFGLTLFSLIGVMATGLMWRKKRRRSLHLSLVGVTLGLLVWTIVAAYDLGEHYILEDAGWVFYVHMTLARLGTLSLILPAFTGLMVMRSGRHHRIHRVGAFLTFGLIAAAAITGFWMIALATPVV